MTASACHGNRSGADALRNYRRRGGRDGSGSDRNVRPARSALPSAVTVAGAAGAPTGRVQRRRAGEGRKESARRGQ